MGPIFLFVAAQAASAAMAVDPPAAMPPQARPAPDLEITAHVEARSLEIRQQGTAQAQVTVDPGHGAIEVRRSQPERATRYRNFEIDARVAAFVSLDDDGTLTVSNDNPTGEPNP